MSAEDLPAIQKAIRKRFPEVRQLSTRDLAAWLGDDARRPPLIVDVRAMVEFKVSHLQHAKHWESAEAIRDAAPSRETPIVVYCSVGYRSSAVAEKLMRWGFSQVWNLDGSLFAWANEGRPVYRGRERVTVVHPYDSHWGKMLNSERHPTAKPESSR